MIIDTLASVSPIDDENDATKVISSLLPVQAAQEAGAAVIIVHHSKKKDSGEGRASRGSGALTGHVDIILELRRVEASAHENRKRSIVGYSRFERTPPEVVIELTDSGYQACGTIAQVKQDDRTDAILRQLPDSPPGKTPEEIHDDWSDTAVHKPSKKSIERDLKAEDAIERTGEGVKGDPFRYHRKQVSKDENAIPDSPPSKGEERNPASREASCQKDDRSKDENTRHRLDTENGSATGGGE